MTTRAADLITQVVIGIHYETTDEDMTRISYAHPTYSETLKEAYLIASGQGALNIPKIPVSKTKYPRHLLNAKKTLNQNT